MQLYRGNTFNFCRPLDDIKLFQRAKNKFRIYLIQGDAPNVSMKHDKHGQYFTVRSESTATAEKIIDNTFHNRVAIP